MVVTQITEAKFPTSKSPTSKSPTRTLSPKASSDRPVRLQQSDFSSDQEHPPSSIRSASPRVRNPECSTQMFQHYSQSSKKVEMFRSGFEESHIHLEHSILHEHFLPK
jgi:hypothetical protein